MASLIAISLFTIGTLLCGLAKSMPMLIAARGLAGCGGGGIMTISSIVASDIIPLKKRGLIQGIVNIFYGLGELIGQIPQFSVY
jgi:MFS family permease